MWGARIRACVECSLYVTPPTTCPLKTHAIEVWYLRDSPDVSITGNRAREEPNSHACTERLRTQISTKIRPQTQDKHLRKRKHCALACRSPASRTGKHSAAHCSFQASGVDRRASRQAGPYRRSHRGPRANALFKRAFRLNRAVLFERLLLRQLPVLSRATARSSPAGIGHSQNVQPPLVFCAQPIHSFSRSMAAMRAVHMTCSALGIHEHTQTPRSCERETSE
eukprot:5454148-Pleurochrysis_carterae.AAC.2